MSSRFFREALSLESEVSGEVAIDPMQADLALESATVEITEAGHQVELLGYQQEELEHAHASLESISASLESLVASDERGLDRVAAEGYRHAITAVVGDALPNPVASLESFGGESECSAATQLSMEGIKDTIKKIWEAIKRAVTNAIKAVSDFFAKLFGGVDALEKKFKSVKDGIEKAKKEGYVAGEEKFKAPGADRLEFEGKFDVSAITAGLKLLSSDVKSTVDTIASNADEYYTDLAGFYKKAKDPKEVDEFVNDKAKVVTEISKKSKVVGKMLPGGKSIVSESKSEGDAPSIPTIKIADHPNAKNFSGDATIAVPSLDDAEMMVAEGLKLVEWMNSAKKSREAIVKSRQDSVKAAESWVKDGESGKLGEAWTGAKVNGAMYLAQRSMDGNLSRIDGYMFSYARGLAAFADAVVKQYGEKKEEKKDGE